MKVYVPKETIEMLSEERFILTTMISLKKQKGWVELEVHELRETFREFIEALETNTLRNTENI